MVRLVWLIFVGVISVATGRRCISPEICISFKSCPSAVSKLRSAQASRNPAQRQATIAEIRKDICGAPEDRAICCLDERPPVVEERPARRRPADKDGLVYLGRLTNFVHDVAGEVYAVGRNQLLIKGFHYDGLGPDAFILADTVSKKPNSGGRVVIPYPNEEKYYAYSDPNIPILPGFNGEDVLLTLPPGVAVSDLTWISVWCRAFDLNFGHLILA